MGFIVAVRCMRISALASCSIAVMLAGEVVSRSSAHAQTLVGNQIPYYDEFVDLTPAPSPAAPSTSSSIDQLPPVPMGGEADPVPFGSSEITAPEAANFPTPTLLTEPGITTQSPTPPSPVSPSEPAVPLPSEPGIAVVQVDVLGVEEELQQFVRATIQTQAGGTTSDSQLQTDVEALRATGFFTTAEVQTVAVGEGLRVTFVVEPVVVRSLQLSGATVLPSTVANQAFWSQLGQPIRPSAIQEGVNAINQWYIDNGYTLAQVVGIQPSPDGVLVLEVVEAVVGDIRIQFVNDEGSPVQEDGDPINGRTRDSFIRQYIQLQPGEVFNEQDAQADLARLADLGLFESASVEVEVEGTVADVIYNLNESPSRSFNVGGGYSTDIGLYGTITYRDDNFSGIGNQLGGDLRVSERGVEYGLRFTSPYREIYPDRLGYSLNTFNRRLLSPTFTEEVELPNGDRVRERRIGGGVSVLRPLGEWDAELGLNYTNYRMIDADGETFSEDELGNELTLSGTGVDDLFTLSFEATRDDRDDIDNPSDGSILTLRAEQSIPIGNGNIFMNRLQANYSYFLPTELLGGSRDNNPETLAFNVQGGAILGDAPPYYAFNLGGTNSVRGYDTSEVGTGRFYVQATTEYRFPIFSFLGGVVFADFASDLGSAGAIPGEPAEVRDKPGTGFGFGLGVRADTPLGLIRLDFGINNEGDNRLHFGFGQRF